jgi:tight adherence protein B
VSPAALITLAIGCIAFLIAWLLGEDMIKAFKRFERSYLERVHLALDAIYSRTSPKKFFYYHMGILTLLFLLVTSAIGPVNGLLLAGLAGVFPWVSLAKARRKRREKIEDQLPDSLINMANSLRAGLTLPQAFGILVDNTAPPISQEFGLLLNQLRLGLTMEEALNELAERVGSKNVDLVVTAIQVATQTGGHLPQVFEDTATAIREIARLEAKISSMTAQGRLQAWVLGSLPIGMAFLIYKVDPKMVAPLWEDPIGWIILFFIAVMEIVGVYMIRKILTVDV